MAPFKDLREFFDGSLRLPIGGKTYVIPPISATDGLWAQALLNTAVAASAGAKVNVDATLLDDDDERGLYARMLGPVYDELLADNQDWPTVQRVGVTAYLFFTVGEEPAVKYWEEGPGNVQAPNRATKRAAARSTRSRGSASGTTTPASKPTAAKRTPGAKSSRTGRSSK